MNTDKELLELAAKAACIELMEWTGDGDLTCPNMFWSPSLKQYWNPLTDDGDALRLAVKLNFTLRMYSGNTCAQSGAPGSTSVYLDETNHINPYKATRRAIVRAASEIGNVIP